MTKDEKFKAIVERIKAQDWCKDPFYISTIMIIHYLDCLQSEGILECEAKITPIGKDIVSICEEFDWKPSDKDIKKYAVDMLDVAEQPAMQYMLQQYRDNKEELLRQFNEIKKSGGSSPTS